MNTTYEGVRFIDIYREPVVSTAPTSEPLSVTEARNHIREFDGLEDAVIESYIKSAREEVERDARLALMTQTLILYLDCFPSWTVELRKPPVVSISSVAYLDTAGTSTTLAASNYRLDANSKPGRLTPAYGEVWPSTYDVTNAVTITFVAGYTSAANVPELAKQAIRLKLTERFEDRDGSRAKDFERAYNSLIAKLQWFGL